MQNVQSYNTAISRKKASVPLRYLEDKGYLRGAILDYGCGKSADFNHLKKAGYIAEAYDPRGYQRNVSLDLNVVKENSGYCIYSLSN